MQAMAPDLWLISLVIFPCAIYLLGCLLLDTLGACLHGWWLADNFQKDCGSKGVEQAHDLLTSNRQ